MITNNDMARQGLDSTTISNSMNIHSAVMSIYNVQTVAKMLTGDRHGQKGTYTCSVAPYCKGNAVDFLVNDNKRDKTT